MMKVTLFTSGSTKEPKQITHTDMLIHIKRSVAEIGLRSDDVVLDVFPSNVIAHYTITAQPALHVGAHLITSSFEPYQYMRLFKEYRPTFISLVPRHHEILSRTKGWNELDMSCVRYMVTGSSIVSQGMIDEFLSKGVKTVANWYGMTEMPPPILIGYNSEAFDFSSKSNFVVTFSDEGECIINDYYTGDIFDLHTRKFLRRKINASNKDTWKAVA
jgi:long-subunit acyl-CoA synthetase (AMP-forming)